MTAPVSSSSEMAAQTHVFEPFDTKICRLIYTALNEDFQAFLDKGLDPNYVLETDVVIEGMLFVKGSPLLMIIVHCCTVSTSPWDLWMMMRLLLEKGANVKKKFLIRGGGKAVFWNMRVNRHILLMKTFF